MRILNRNTAGDLLRSQGIATKVDVEKVLNGFDFSKPVYEHEFWPGDVLYQLIRLPSATLPVPATGNWFGLAGITTGGVAINDGLSGRQAVKFEVVASFRALEGSAKALPVDLGSAIGGTGGATQIFLPRTLLGHLQSVGPVARW
jgi:putative RNase toxin 46 of polymorphic toxin system